VFVVFGLAIAPVAASVQSYLPAFTVALGLLLAAVGLWLVAGRRLPSLPVLRRRTAAAGSPVVASWPTMMGFGASYAVASLGCTIAPFLAVVVTSFRSGSPAAGLVLFAHADHHQDTSASYTPDGIRPPVVSTNTAILPRRASTWSRRLTASD
jgi:cytochrome c biogenesis protein CcdA